MGISEWLKSTKTRGNISTFLVFCIFLLLSLNNWDEGLYGDGPWLLEIMRQGGWLFGHILYIPTVKLADTLFSKTCGLELHESMMAVSSLSTAGICTITFRWGYRLVGGKIAAFVLLLLWSCPTLKFYSGATEIHALAGMATLVGLYLTWSRCMKGLSTRHHSLLGYLLASFGHLTCATTGPCFMILNHCGLNKKGKFIDWARIVATGALMAAALLVALSIFIAIDGSWGIKGDAWQGLKSSYFDFMFKMYDQRTFKVPVDYVLVVEFLFAFWPLMFFSLVGILPAWKKNRHLAAMLVLWLLALSYCVFRVGAREFGAYLLPALPAAGLLSGFAVSLIVSSGSYIKLAVSIVGLLCPYLSMASWAGAKQLHLGKIVDLHYPWIVSVQDLSLLPCMKIMEAASRLPYWCYLAAMAPLIAICWINIKAPTLMARGSRKRKFGLILSLATIGIAGISYLGQSTFRERRQFWTYAPWVNYCKYLKREVRGSGIVVGFAPFHPNEFSARYFLDGSWLNTRALDDIGTDGISEAISNYMLSIKSATESGKKIFLSEDGLALLSLHPAPNGAARKFGLDFIGFLLDRYPVVVLPAFFPEFSGYAKKIVKIQRN